VRWEGGDPVFRDDFAGGLDVGTSESRWQLRPAGALPDGDGIVRASPDGLVVVPTGINAATGEPAFSEASGQGPGDILRWAVFTTHTASSGVLGFDAPAGQILTAATRMSARAFGNANAPFGDSDPDSDMRVGAAALICIDRASGLILDFVLTNHTTYALYERLGGPDSDHATFSYAVDVGRREPGQSHHLAVALDVAAGTARWLLDGTEVLRVDALGHRVLDPRYLLRSGGGAEQTVRPGQLNVGLAMFASGVWGQGVELTVRHVSMSLSPATDEGTERDATTTSPTSTTDAPGPA
jgi:hypothetical protein